MSSSILAFKTFMFEPSFSSTPSFCFPSSSFFFFFLSLDSYPVKLIFFSFLHFFIFSLLYLCYISSFSSLLFFSLLFISSSSSFLLRSSWVRLSFPSSHLLSLSSSTILASSGSSCTLSSFCCSSWVRVGLCRPQSSLVEPSVWFLGLA